MGQRTNAAVIGAGAAGLVCARELARQNIEVTIFEKSSQVGGVWVYEPEVDDDITGVDPTSTVHSSLYDSLRTNLPRDLMAFSDYYFDSTGGGEDTWPRYPHHSKVLEYLERFAVDHDLTKTMRLGTTVTRLKPSPEERGDDANRRPQWLVESEDAGGNFSREAFDAVAVCNGHYSKPRVPILPGMESFPGYVIHSHNYRRPDEFKNMKVAVWGTAASGADIAREIASVATEVYWCGNAFELPTRSGGQGIDLYPSPVSCSGSRIIFNDQVCLDGVDAFVYCTGYEFNFPFLEKNIVSVEDNWVHPLYLDLVSTRFENLAFIGLPYLVIPFRLFEMQSRWFASGIAGEMRMPHQQEMMHAYEASRQKLIKKGVPKHHYHRLGDAQTDYINLLAKQCGADTVPEWYMGLALEAQKARIADPEGFRARPLKFQGPTVVLREDQLPEVQ